MAGMESRSGEHGFVIRDSPGRSSTEAFTDASSGGDGSRCSEHDKDTRGADVAAVVHTRDASSTLSRGQKSNVRRRKRKGDVAVVTSLASTIVAPEVDGARLATHLGLLPVLAYNSALSCSSSLSFTCCSSALYIGAISRMKKQRGFALEEECSCICRHAHILARLFRI